MNENKYIYRFWLLILSFASKDQKICRTFIWPFTSREALLACLQHKYHHETVLLTIIFLSFELLHFRRFNNPLQGKQLYQDGSSKTLQQFSPEYVLDRPQKCLQVIRIHFKTIGGKQSEPPFYRKTFLSFILFDGEKV